MGLIIIPSSSPNHDTKRLDGMTLWGQTFSSVTSSVFSYIVLKIVAKFIEVNNLLPQGTPLKSKVSGIQCETRCYFPKRYIMTLLGCLGMFNIYAMRVNLSVAMVAMVNSTTPLSSNQTYQETECSNLVRYEPPTENEGFKELWFQQDGATCHTARASIDLLKDTFGDRLISRFGPVNWPTRSCDLTPLDYFLWGYVKSSVYADKPQTLDHLKDNIRRVTTDIRPQMLEKVIENWSTSEPAVACPSPLHLAVDVV
ncbi:uncharacterized protein TNCV_1419451 [Trichonephila clavipes]|nr:uncharacterized protein TNCV_1419451 [Trichonephila clavipes]